MITFYPVVSRDVTDVLESGDNLLSLIPFDFLPTLVTFVQPLPPTALLLFLLGAR